jgi:hypothetical protein
MKKNMVLSWCILVVSLAGCGGVPIITGLPCPVDSQGCVGMPLIGYCTLRNEDAYPYQPLGRPGKEVLGYEFEKIYFDHGQSQFIWQLSWGKKIKADDVTELCEVFLKKKGMLEEVKHVKIVYDERYPWNSSDPVLQWDREQRTGKALGYDNTMTIVCLDPLVIIIAKGKIEYWSREFSNTPKLAMEVSNKAQNYLSRVKYFVLSRGFAYGTRMPYDVEPRWFSPDMDIAPRPVEIDRDGIGHIKVPWGELLMERHEDQWRITAPR